MKWFKDILLLIVLSIPSILLAQPGGDETTGDYLYRSIVEGEDTLLYRIMYPHDFDRSKQYPVVVFFHGMGERGSDNERQLYHGSRLFRDSLSKYPAIVVFPQCPETDYWANLYRPDEGGADRKFSFYYADEPNPSMRLTIKVIEDLLSQDYTDNARLYASGLSMGGMGTFEFAYRMQDRLACAMPICGGGPPEKAKDMVDVPFWIFHGAKDDVVHPRYSEMMCKAIQRAGGKAKLTMFPDANHNSWDPAFDDPEYLSWMFSNRRK